MNPVLQEIKEKSKQRIMTTQELHANTLRNVPFKYGQPIFFIENGSQCVLPATIVEIKITLNKGEPKFDLVLLTNRLTVVHEKIAYDELWRVDTDALALINLVYQKRLQALDEERADLQRKMSQLDFNCEHAEACYKNAIALAEHRGYIPKTV